MITNKRAVASTVMVNDGEIVVIGGLFRYQKRSQNKTNLMIFLRPTLVRDSASTNAYTVDRYDYIVGQQVKARPAPSAVLPDLDSPVFPPRAMLPPLDTKPARAGVE